jgi:hypothetical protein
LTFQPFAGYHAFSIMRQLTFALTGDIPVIYWLKNSMPPGITENILELAGQTRLLHLSRFARPSMADIYAKLEYILRTVRVLTNDGRPIRLRAVRFQTTRHAVLS